MSSHENLKAAEVKGLVPAVLQLLKKHGGQSPLEKHMTAMMTSLNQFYDLMQECPIVPGENGHMFSVHMVKFLVHYQWLAKTYFREDKKTIVHSSQASLLCAPGPTGQVPQS